MSEADELFEKLGFNQINSKPTFIEYFNRNYSWGAYERVKIDYKNKRIVRDAKTGQGNRAIRYITMQELQAINQKCKELGWI